MVDPMWIFPLILVSLHTNYLGKSLECSKKHQCNYTIAQNQMKSNDTIFFHDKYIVNATHLHSFRVFSSAALSLGIKINGVNTVINGSLSEHYSPAFLTISGNSTSSINNFTFIEFKHSIIHVNGPIQLKLHNISFNDISIYNKKSIFNLENSSQMIVKHSNFSFLTADQSSIFSIASSSLEFHFCIIDNLFLFHSINEFSIIELTNSSLLLQNSVITRSSTPYGALIQLKTDSILFIKNSSLISNQNQYIIDSKDSHTIFFNNSLIYDNQASFISTHTKNTQVTILNTCFENNHCPLSSFFNIQTKSLMILDNNCTFILNSGTFSLIRSLNSNIIINNSKFEDNSFDDTIIKSTENSQLIIDSSQFQNSQSKNAVIYANNSNFSITNSNISYSWSPSIFTESSYMNVSRTIFENSEAHSKISVISHNSTKSYLSDSLFKDESLTFSIEIQGQVFLSNLQFNTPKEFALPSRLLKKCHNCHFPVQHSTNELHFQFDYSIFVMISLSLIIWALIIFIFRKRLKQLFRKCRTRKIND